eukprot:NODE_15743_length_1033_cov_2.628035.p1 GENE.NODE_15743_length_1033_cov_2.628035~~NODE_15743_length_1033_cov_2.628035.p1  ORF type:complete len:268 (+),score=78.03 NODE_15743_length_1033_cov_2.628035:78-806(+)
MADPSLANKDVVKFSVDQEQLGRVAHITPGGAVSATQPEVVASERRTIFDVKGTVLQDSTKAYDFFRDEYSRVAGLFLQLVRQEIAAAAPDSEIPQSAMTRSILRHNLYPSGGCCGAHTDNGLMTWQHTTDAGLQVWTGGRWRSVAHEGGAYILAGDMMEHLTAGAVPAILHRVVLPDVGGQPGAATVRQSAIFFAQPSDDDVVRPSASFRATAEGAGLACRDYEPVRFGSWHEVKKRIAFK